MTSTRCATVPVKRNWRHLASQIRELPDGRAAELAELGDLLVRHLADGALADRSLRMVPGERLTAAQAVRLYHLHGEMYAPAPPQSSVRDIATMERAFRLFTPDDVTMAICYAHEMLGGELDDRQLGIEGFADRAIVERLLDLAGAHDPDPSQEEVQAEQEALDEWFDELDAGLLLWPDADNAALDRPDAGIGPAESQAEETGTQSRPTVATLLAAPAENGSERGVGVPEEVTRAADQIVKLRAQLEQIGAELTRTADPEVTTVRCLERERLTDALTSSRTVIADHFSDLRRQQQDLFAYAQSLDEQLSDEHLAALQRDIDRVERKHRLAISAQASAEQALTLRGRAHRDAVLAQVRQLSPLFPGVRFVRVHWVVPMAGDGGRTVWGCTCWRGLKCGSPGNHPLDEGWPDKATSDPEVIAGWWGRIRWSIRVR